MKNKSFLKNVITLLTGTAFGQLLLVISTPILTRLYSPEDFGLLGLYVSIVSVVVVVMTLKYELAIVLPKNIKEAANVFWLSIFIVITLTLILTLLVLVFREKVSLILGAPKLSNWLWFLPLSAFSLGIFNSFNYWSTRQKEFRRISNSKIAQSSGIVAIQLSGGFLKLGMAGLIFGQVFGQILGMITFWKQVWRRDKELLINSFDSKEVSKVAKRYLDFPKYNSTQSLLNSISQNAAPLLLGFFFTPVVVGFYTLAMRLIKMPINLISESFRQVYFQRISELYNKGEKLSAELKKATLYLFFIGIIPTILIFFLSPMLFSFFLGEEWRIAGSFASWIVIWLFPGFVNRPAVSTIQILKKQKYLLQYEIALFLVRIVLLALSAYYFDALTAIALYSIVGAFFNTMLIISTILLVKSREQKSD